MKSVIALAAIIALFTFPLATFQVKLRSTRHGHVGEHVVAILTEKGVVGTVDPADPVLRKVATVPNAGDIALGEDGLAFVRTTEFDLYVVDLHNPSSRPVDINAKLPVNRGGITFGPDGLLYIISQNEREDGSVLYGVNPQNVEVERTIQVKDFKRSGGDIVWVADREAFYANNRDSGVFVRIDIDGNVERVGEIRAKVRGLAYVDNTLYGYASPDKQFVINLDNGRILSTKTVRGVDDGDNIMSAGSPCAPKINL